MKPHQYWPSRNNGCQTVVDGKRCGQEPSYSVHEEWERAQLPTKQEKLASIRRKIECSEACTDPSMIRVALIELLELLEEEE